MMIVTLMKLLVISIVARVRSESSLSIRIFLSFTLSESNSDKSFGVKLKKAISEPLANADINSKNNDATRQIIALMPGA
jgi:accessory gene regulator protein AgrB